MNVPLHLSIRDVAQSGSAPALGAGGREFKSPHPDQRWNKKFSDLQVMKAGLFLQTVKLLLHSLLQPLPKTQAILHQFELRQ